MTPAIRVVIHDEHEIFSRGLHASLLADASVRIRRRRAPSDAHTDVDVIVVSSAIAGTHAFTCPLVVCADDRGLPGDLPAGNVVAAVLARAVMRPTELRAAIRAAASGLRVDVDSFTPPADSARD